MTKQVRFRLDFESTKRSWSPSISVRGSATKEEKERLINSLIAKKVGNNLSPLHCKCLQWCQIEYQQSPFYVVNGGNLNHDYIP